MSAADLMRDARDLLRAIDRGDYGTGHIMTSAYVQALRDSLRRYSEQRQVEMFQEDYARIPGACLYSEINARRAR